MKKNNPFKRQIKNATFRKPAIGVLQDRLQETLILELHKNGNKEYKNMTLRGLYSRVMNVITQRPTDNQQFHNFDKSQNEYLGERNKQDDISGIRSPVTPQNDVIDNNLHEASESLQHLARDVIQEEQQRFPLDLPMPPPPPPSLSHTPLASVDKENKSLQRSRRHARSYTITDHDTMIPPKRTPSINKPSTGVSPPTPVLHHRASSAPTYRERLGGYLHPRDMRRLVTPFSSSFNEPELMIRRHVMLLNFDPLRAIVLRDRVLVFVPNGADSMLNGLERRVFGGIMEMHQEVLGGPDWALKNNQTFSATSSLKAANEEPHLNNNEYFFDNEWDDIKTQKWIDMAFELISVDAVLQTVCTLMYEEAGEQINQAKDIMSILAGDARSKVPIHVSQERLRKRKDEIKEMEARVQGFVRAMNLVLDDDEDMALMNLSRLVTHPERFIQPVSEDILHEESDEPELILEAYLQQALSIVNALHLVEGKINSTEELLMMKLDTVRNRLLWINTVLSLVSISIALASLVGSMFGMNLINGYEDSETMFGNVVLASVVGSVGMLAALYYIFYRAGSVSVKFN